MSTHSSFQVAGAASSMRSESSPAAPPRVLLVCVLLHTRVPLSLWVLASERGCCTLHSLEPVPVLEAAFARLHADISGQFLSQAAFEAELRAM